MNERQFKAKMRKDLKGCIHIQAVEAALHAGTPDLWMSGKKQDCWIEVKYKALNQQNIADQKQPKLPLTTLQKKWLTDRFNEGRNVLVVMGVSPHAIILYRTPAEWLGEAPGVHMGYRTFITELVRTVRGDAPAAD